MPIVLDCAPGGAIIGGHFFSFVPEGAVESGAWRVIIPQAIYARAAHIVRPPVPMPDPLPVVRGVQMGGVAPAMSVRDVAESDVLPSQREVKPVALGAGQEGPLIAQPHPPSGKRSASPSPPAAPSPGKKPRPSAPSLIARLPIAVNIHENTGVASVANTSDPRENVAPRASQISHVGTTFPTRRAILLRHDKPYVCDLCGEGFPHPADVKAHFSGHPDIPRRGCWMKNGSKVGVTWDEHESCKVREGELNLVTCKEGRVIVDQESWDKISRATEAGKRILQGKGKDKEDGRVGLNGGDKTAIPEDELSGIQDSQQPPETVVRAGDEIEMDTGAGRSKRKTASRKAPSKKKSKRAQAVDETNKDTGVPTRSKEADTAQHEAQQARLPDKTTAQTSHDTEAKDGAPTATETLLQTMPLPKANAGRAGNPIETESTDVATPTTKAKAPPKRKVVRAGDETETDVSASRSK